jgi:hypothetical protein
MLSRTAAILLALPLGAPVVFGRAMSLPVTISDLKSDGVTLVSPLDPTFDDLARPLIGRRAGPLFGLKPLLVVVTNDTSKTIAAASIVFRVARPVGGFTAWTNVSFPDVVVGDLGSDKRHGVRPNESTVVARGIVVEDFDGPEPEDWYRQTIETFVRERDDVLQDAQSLTIELNAVIFDDGTLIGPDDGKLAALFTAKVSAYQHWLQTIADGLAAGQSVETACLPMVKFRDDVNARGGSLRGNPRDQVQAEIEKTNAAADVAGWRRRIGDAELPRALAKLRLSTLVVHR